MGSADLVDDRTFNGDFSVEGVAKLKEMVKDKLKEYMGDYTDDILVEYVIVLLRNGRRKEEANNELKIFLGDDSDSFVAWYLYISYLCVTKFIAFLEIHIH